MGSVELYHHRIKSFYHSHTCSVPKCTECNPEFRKAIMHYRGRVIRPETCANDCVKCKLYKELEYKYLTMPLAGLKLMLHARYCLLVSNCTEPGCHQFQVALKHIDEVYKRGKPKNKKRLFPCKDNCKFCKLHLILSSFEHEVYRVLPSSHFVNSKKMKQRRSSEEVEPLPVKSSVKRSKTSPKNENQRIENLTSAFVTEQFQHLDMDGTYSYGYYQYSLNLDEDSGEEALLKNLT